MRISFLIVSLAVCCFVFACGGDDEVLVDAAGPPPDAPIGTSPDANTTDAPAIAIDAVLVDASAAMIFCSTYETVCGFDNQTADRYDDAAACVAAYDGYSPTRTTCVENHLVLASSGSPADVTTHCPHAAGMPPCGP